MNIKIMACWDVTLCSLSAWYLYTKQGVSSQGTVNIINSTYRINRTGSCPEPDEFKHLTCNVHYTTLFDENKNTLTRSPCFLHVCVFPILTLGPADRYLQD